MKKTNLAVLTLMLALETVAFAQLDTTIITTKANITIKVDDPRPLSRMAELLELKYGVPISYEDAAWVNTADLIRAAEGRWNVPPNSPVIIPSGGRLMLQLPTDENGQPLDSLESVLESVVAQHKVNQNPGEFRVIHVGDGGNHLAIVPVAAKDIFGTMVAQRSPLDTLISFPEAERPAELVIQIVRGLVGGEIGIPIYGHALASNSLIHNNVTIGAKEETARSVLFRIFQNIRPGQSNVQLTTWGLNYDPGNKAYTLNLYGLMKEVVTERGMQRQPVYRTATLPQK